MPDFEHKFTKPINRILSVILLILSSNLFANFERISAKGIFMASASPEYHVGDRLSQNNRRAECGSLFFGEKKMGKFIVLGNGWRTGDKGGYRRQGGGKRGGMIDRLIN